MKTRRQMMALAPRTSCSLLVLLLLAVATLAQDQGLLAESTVELEFDESDIRNLNLQLKWRFTDVRGAQKTRSPSRFILLMQQKRLNVSSFVFDVPQLIDDGKRQEGCSSEQVVDEISSPHFATHFRVHHRDLVNDARSVQGPSGRGQAVQLGLRSTLHQLDPFQRQQQVRLQHFLLRAPVEDVRALRVRLQLEKVSGLLVLAGHWWSTSL